MRERLRNAWTAPDPEVLRFGARILRQGGRCIHDLGCGPGRHTLALASTGLHVVASDVEHAAVAGVVRTLHARRLAGCGLAGSMLAAPFAAASFDGVVAFNVLYHATYMEMKTAVAEVFRTLRPGGLAYMTLATPEHGGYGHGREVEPHTFASPSGLLHRFVDRDGGAALLYAFDIVDWGRSELDYVNRRGDTIRCVHWRITARKPVSSSTPIPSGSPNSSCTACGPLGNPGRGAWRLASFSLRWFRDV